jgi:MoaA/NifB/PqqE/SkfB family radical SAM enzyme
VQYHTVYDVVWYLHVLVTVYVVHGDVRVHDDVHVLAYDHDHISDSCKYVLLEACSSYTSSCAECELSVYSGGCCCCVYATVAACIYHLGQL